jgi:epoxyqueuosine reductase
MQVVQNWRVLLGMCDARKNPRQFLCKKAHLAWQYLQHFVNIVHLRTCALWPSVIEPMLISKRATLKIIMRIDQERQRNAEHLRRLFQELLVESGEQGVFGVSDFRQAYMSLLPVQQTRLKILLQDNIERYIKSGHFISIGIAYEDSAIDDINTPPGKNANFERWNHYASEYRRLNSLLDNISQVIATESNGISIPATLSGLTKTVSHVSDYYEHTVSHRVIAELAGLGWRGKNGLIINPKFSCALRFASIITEMPLSSGKKLESQCGECRACEEACSFIKNREKLQDYRENCRRYLISLQDKGLKAEVCGKCIQACLRKSIFSKQFNLGKRMIKQR